MEQFSNDPVQKEDVYSTYIGNAISNNSKSSIEKYYIVQYNNINIGLISIANYKFEIDSILITNFYIESNYRNKGLGSIVLNKIELIIKNKFPKVTTLKVGCFLENKSSYKLYTKNGFINKDNVKPKKYWPILLEKQIVK